MWGRSIGRVCVKPHTDDDKRKAMFHNNRNSSKRVDEEGSRHCSSNFRVPKRSSKLSPVLKFLKRLGHKMKITSVVRSVSTRKRASPKVSSSSEKTVLPCVAPVLVDSHRAEAIDDCIQFINSSSTLPRSNSVPY